MKLWLNVVVKQVLYKIHPYLIHIQVNYLGLQLVYTHAIEFYYDFQLRSERLSIIAYVAHKRFLKRNTPTIRVSKEIVTNECQELAFSSTSTSKFDYRIIKNKMDKSNWDWLPNKLICLFSNQTSQLQLDGFYKSS